MKDRAEEEIIPTMCATHCGGACLLRVHVKDGVITRVETDDGEEPQLRACMRGRALRERVYSPDRILYPMKRVGRRGEGKFERVTWDEALDTVSLELKRIRNQYGPEALLYLDMAGDMVSLNTPATMNRLLAQTGGYSTWWGTTSFHGGTFASFFTYGTIYCSNTRDDLLNSRLIILWGWDPGGTTTGTNTAWFLVRAKEEGARIIAVDPYYSDSAATFAEEWIPIRPGTDAAMLIAMANVMIKEGLRDQRFLDTYTIGFEKFKDYVLGMEDGIEKTPHWAEAITGVDRSTIERLGEEYATTQPAALMAGIAPGRTAFGEQYHRAAMTLACMTGNVGIHGGDAAARAWESLIGGYPYGVGLGAAFPYVRNPLDEFKPRHLKVPLGEVYPRIHFTKVADAILRGKAGGYPADYKMVFMVNTNYLNSFPNTNKIAKALEVPEFIVIEEQFMTPTARYSDILLPTTTFVERDDMALGVGLAFCGFQRKVIEPLGECRSQVQIARELAIRLDVADFDEKTDEEKLRDLASQLNIPDYDAFKNKGVHWIGRSEPYCD